MSNNKLTCPRCNGKGTTKLKDVEMVVKCPVCNGAGLLNNDFLESEQTETKIEPKQTVVQQNKDIQIQILKQIIKHPDLFLNGIKLLFQDENKEIFIYLQNQYIFEIENQLDGILIKIKSEFKNSLAKQCIEYLTKKHKENKNV